MGTVTVRYVGPMDEALVPFADREVKRGGVFEVSEEHAPLLLCQPTLYEPVSDGPPVDWPLAAPPAGAPSLDDKNEGAV